MPPTFLVGVDLKAFRHAGNAVVGRHVASPAWRTRRAAVAGVRALPWPHHVGFADPAGTTAARALHEIRRSGNVIWLRSIGSYLSTKSVKWPVTSASCRLLRRRSLAAMSAETSRNQPSAELSDTTANGSLY